MRLIKASLYSASVSRITGGGFARLQLLRLLLLTASKRCMTTAHHDLCDCAPSMVDFPHSGHCIPCDAIIAPLHKDVIGVHTITHMWICFQPDVVNFLGTRELNRPPLGPPGAWCSRSTEMMPTASLAPPRDCLLRLMVRLCHCI